MKDFYTRLRDFIIPKDKSPAKRIRPMVLVHAYFGIANDVRVEKYLGSIREISIAIELLHNAAIIHDDVVDQDEYRRGLPTFHKIFESVFKERNQNSYGDAALWGNGCAIHGGDLCAFLGEQVIMNSKFESNMKSMALREYNEGYKGIVRGKLIENYLQLESLENSSLEDYILMSEYKTSQQFDTAASIGAILADTRLTQIKPLKRAMNHLGVAYQIQNDINDSFGNPELKAIDLDIKERKRNILIITAYHNAKGQDKKDLEQIFNARTEMSEKEVNRVREVIEGSGALDFAKLYSQNMIAQAGQELNKIYPGLRVESHNFFTKLLEYVNNKK